MKKHYLLFTFLLFLLCCGSVRAAITVVAGANGTNICANRSATGTDPAFTVLTSILLREGNNNDITTGGHTLTINPPAGWQFNIAIPATVSFATGRNITSATVASITASSLTITFNVTGAALSDTLRINGLGVQATSTTSANGNITASSSVGLTGVIPTVTNFGSLSLSPVPDAVTVTGAGSFCDNTTLVASLSSAGTIYYQGVIADGTSTTTPSTSEFISVFGTHTYYFRAQAATGGCWGPQTGATVTISQSPTAASINPLTGTFICLGGSATLVGGAIAPEVPLLEQDFNNGLGAWSITNISGNATSYFQLRSAPGYNSVVPGDGSAYIEAAPDATNSASLPTNSIFTSPSFSTLGYTAATLSFNQYYRFYPFDVTASVEYSIDGGITWTSIAENISSGFDVGTTSWAFGTASTFISLPADAVNMPDVMLRWNYNSVWGWYWAIDNIVVTGTPVLAYTWVGISGATGIACTTCDTTAVTPAAIGGNDYMVTTEVAGCAASAGITISVAPPATGATVTPASATLCHGNNVNLASAGVAGVTYQWNHNGVAITGATNATYTADTSGAYTLSTDNGTCAATSAPVTVLPDPTAIASYNTSGHYLYTGSFASYQWYRNGSMIPGATSSIYPPVLTGAYKVVVKDVNGCSDTSAVYNFVGTTTGIGTIAAAGDVLIYPNPASSVLHIEAPFVANVRIMSVDGRMITEQNEATSLDVSQLANGVYMIMVYDAGNMLVKTQKFSKIN